MRCGAGAEWLQGQVTDDPPQCLAALAAANLAMDELVAAQNDIAAATARGVGRDNGRKLSAALLRQAAAIIAIGELRRERAIAAPHE